MEYLKTFNCFFLENWGLLSGTHISMFNFKRKRKRKNFGLIQPAEYPREYSATIGVIFGCSATIRKMCGYSTTIGGKKFLNNFFG